MAETARNIRLFIEYDGTGFSGWQRLAPAPSGAGRRRGRSIQGEVERAIRGVTRQKINIIGAGRTDAGVHALGQVANFKIEHSLS
ncbi:MAG TPA: hypothetical protein VFH67_05655, partial [bacterium]|nr:hypothetical protein [bacterium]